MEARRLLIQPVGAFFSQVGELNYVHHIWAYKDLHARKIIREKCWQIEGFPYFDSGWANTVYRTHAMTDKMSSCIMKRIDLTDK